MRKNTAVGLGVLFLCLPLVIGLQPVSANTSKHFVNQIMGKEICFFVGSLTIEGIQAEKVDEIGVFTSSGTLVGAARVLNEGMFNVAVTGVKGMAANDAVLTFKVWDHSEGVEIVVTPEMITPQSYGANYPASLFNPPQWTEDKDIWGLSIDITK